MSHSANLAHRHFRFDPGKPESYESLSTSRHVPSPCLEDQPGLSGALTVSAMRDGALDLIGGHGTVIPRCDAPM
jgi:hypothetical protein